MKRFLSPLLSIAIIAAGGTYVQAQLLPSIPNQAPEPLASIAESSHADEPLPPRLLDNREFIFFTRILRNADTRYSPFVPYRFAPRSGETLGREWRGVGQIFAPTINHLFYSGDPYTSTSNIYYAATELGDLTDQDYIDQFVDAGAFRIDSLQMFVYENPAAGRGTTGGRIEIMRTNMDFTSQTYRTNGFAAARAALPVAYSIDISAEALDEASRNDSLLATRIRFSANDSLSFAAGESAIVMYVNDQGDAVGPDNVQPNADVQLVAAQLEWRNGTPGPPDTRTNPLTDYKSLGVVLFRSAGGDSVLSGFRHLAVQGLPAIFDLNMVIWGTVELASGVEYHPGTRASTTSIGSPLPNPVASIARIPFTLATASRVRIDLFDNTGRSVMTLVDAGYPAGAYSCTLRAQGLPSGAYRARMIAGESVVSVMVNVQ